MVAALLELPTGDFVDPTVVTDIQYFPAGEYGSSYHPAERVFITTSSDCVYIVEFGTDRDAAKGFQRDIGKAINAARREQP